MPDTSTPATNGAQAPQVAGAAAFRALGPATLNLPASGLTVRVRRAHLAELALAGAFPDGLTARVLERIGVRQANRPDSSAELRERLAENAALADAVCCAVLLEPRMVPADTDPVPEDAITPEQMPFRDREHVFLYASGLVEEVRRQVATFPGAGAG